jgi:hypothetical protein
MWTADIRGLVPVSRDESEKMIRDIAEQRDLTYEELVEQILRGSD